MMLKMVRLMLVIFLIPAGSASGQSLKIDQAVLAGVASAQVRSKPPCKVSRRVRAGAVIGAIGGMLLVRQAAAENGGSVGARGTLQAGIYGGALGAVIGLATCR